MRDSKPAQPDFSRLSMKFDQQFREYLSVAVPDFLKLRQSIEGLSEGPRATQGIMQPPSGIFEDVESVRAKVDAGEFPEGPENPVVRLDSHWRRLAESAAQTADQLAKFTAQATQMCQEAENSRKELENMRGTEPQNVRNDKVGNKRGDLERIFAETVKKMEIVDGFERHWKGLWVAGMTLEAFDEANGVFLFESAVWSQQSEGLGSFVQEIQTKISALLASADSPTAKISSLELIFDQIEAKKDMIISTASSLRREARRLVEMVRAQLTQVISQLSKCSQAQERVYLEQYMLEQVLPRLKQNLRELKEEIGMQSATQPLNFDIGRTCELTSPES